MKFTYEQEKSLKKMKSIHREVGIIAIVLWIMAFTIIIVCPMKTIDWIIIPIGAIVTVICFLYSGRMIKKVEQLKDK